MPLAVTQDPDRGHRLSAAGAFYAAAAVALAAYAAHGSEGVDRGRLLIAAAFAFGHGLALAALVPCGVVGRIARLAWCFGVLLFCGSVAGGALLDWPTGLAPLGGLLLIGGWLLFAIDLLRR